MDNSRFDKFFDDEIENVLYKISIIALVITLVTYFTLMYIVKATGNVDLLECKLKEVTGIPCPGCGGTRAVKSLLKGNILSSLYYNAFVVYVAIMYGIFFVTHTLQRISRGKIKGIKFRMLYVWIAIAVMVIQYIIKLNI